MTAGHWVTVRGRHIFIDEGDERRLRAIKSYRPQTKAKMRRALEQESVVARALSGENLPDNEAFDVLLRKARIAVEVKTIDKGKNPKITMHPSSRQRKEKWSKSNGYTPVTVVADIRGGKVQYYLKDGIGAFRLSSMQRVTLSGLKEWLSPKGAIARGGGK